VWKIITDGLRDEPIPLYLWTNNSSDHPIGLGSCTEPAYLKAGGFVLYDAYGHRVLNKSQIASDKQCKTDLGILQSASVQAFCFILASSAHMHQRQH
jgi:hypothetical protein